MPKYQPVRRDELPNSSAGTSPAWKQASINEKGQESAGRRSWFLAVLQLLVAVLWLVPIAVLLYFNFSKHIIGASAWCPGGHCSTNAFDPMVLIARKNVNRLNKNDRDVLGALQFVAKALEIWFSIIATWFAYLVTMAIAEQKDGLPIGYITVPFIFSDVVNLFDPLLWTTGPTPWASSPKTTARERRLGGKVVALVVLVTFLCGLCNLMGPATAVLVLPSLQWVSTKGVGNDIFANLNAGEPPQWENGQWFWNISTSCHKIDFENHNYDCAQSPLGDSLDSFIQSFVASGTSWTGATQASGLTFTFNETYDPPKSTAPGALYHTKRNVFWAPNRQTLEQLSIDAGFLQRVAVEEPKNLTIKASAAAPSRGSSFTYDDYVVFSKSLQVIMERRGPIAGGLANMWTSLLDSYNWVIEVDSRRQIRCYHNYGLAWDPVDITSDKKYWNKCIRTGDGWSEQNKQAQFSIQGSWNDLTRQFNPAVKVEVFSSDRAVFLRNYSPESWPTSPQYACFGPTPISNRTICDWKRLFTVDASSALANRSMNVNTIQFSMNDNSGGADLIFAVDFVAFYNFTTYTLDPSVASNPILDVQTQDLYHTGTSFAIDPNWILGSWSVGQYGMVPSHRPIAHFMVQALESMMENPSSYLQTTSLFDEDKLQWASLLPTIQTLSIIDFNTSTVSSADSSNLEDDRKHPLLQLKARRYVWAYSLSTRTSKLGLVVVFLGSAVAIAQAFLGLIDRRKYRSLMQMLVAGLEHNPKDEFHGKESNKKLIARTRFRVKEDQRKAGRLSFPQKT